MVPVDLYDELELTRPRTEKAGQTGLTVVCDHPMVPPGKENLAYKAASLLLRTKEFHDPVHIHIKKKIPVGGGLGGGSSDAAATLIGLNRLLRLGVDRSEMFSLAASLGADVPFFVGGRPARAGGIGEQLKPMSDLPHLRMVILYPGFGVSTRWVYQNLALTLTKAVENTNLKFSLSDPEELGRFLVNDLERVAVPRYPRIGILKERLVQEGAAGVLMAGSGSSVFGIFSAAREAQKAFRRLHKEAGVQAYLVRSLS